MGTETTEEDVVEPVQPPAFPAEQLGREGEIGQRAVVRQQRFTRQGYSENDRPDHLENEITIPLRRWNNPLYHPLLRHP